MKKIAIAAAALVLGTASASAADMAARYTKAPVAVAAVYDWTGFYLGADIGYGWGRSNGTLTNVAGAFPVPYSLDPSGVIGGGFIGYNWQISNVVLGIEADWQAADLNQSGNFLLGGVPTYTIGTSVFQVIFALLTNYVAQWFEKLQVLVPTTASQLMLSGTELPGNPPRWVGAVVLIGYAAVAGVVGTLITKRRDIS